MTKDTRQAYLKIVGERFKSGRAAKGLSLRKLSVICDIDHSDISKIERGEINMRFGTFIALALALDLHPKMMLDFDLIIEE